jgi:type IV secretion system protein VirB2
MNHAEGITTAPAGFRHALAMATVTTLACLPGVASAAPGITGLLNIASVAIVTIAVIFAGYQIAFNHKRIGDVAPVLIGGFLIGAAAQISRMLLSDTGGLAFDGGALLGLAGMLA